MKIWRAGLYLRLSKDDENYKDESMSITNQRKLTEAFVGQNSDIQLVDTYIDDGWSGTNFNRPSFQRMMMDINFNNIDCVIVKDLSRLGRNQSKTAELIDEIFPSLSVRFIAVNDNLDTRGFTDDNDATGFKLFFNEYMVKDTSKKTKSGLQASMARGNFIGSVAPYGYQKDSENKYKLVIDDYSSKIVKYIFDEWNSGTSSREIAQRLNKKKILTPQNYRNQNRGKEIDKSLTWGSVTVIQILKNYVYCGHLIQNKRTKISYKLKKRRFTSEDEQIVVKNTHQAIIDEFTRDKAMKRFEDKFNSKKKKRKNGECMPILFSGLLVCNDCGSKMAATTKHDKRCYRCIKYNLNGSTTCSSHLIYEDDIIAELKTEIGFMLSEYNKSPDSFLNKIMLSKNGISTQEKITANNQIKQCKIRQEEIEKNIVSIFEDRQKGLIADTTYSVLSKKYDDELKDLFTKMQSCGTIVKKNDETYSEVNTWLKVLLNLDIENITDAQIKKIIERIYVSDVNSTERLHIVYKVGSLDDILGKAIKHLSA